ncbi:hypothetical protein [Salinimicrobium marinum]|uniref:hypothetical protein n=1 Tax=Salinimicrobium marinum TaxID=680283 RepID=UPI001672EBA1|nr:hypothetical protein [Salinimicrobium marinum]
MLNTFLLIINNWEKATGHRIKNADNFPIPGSRSGRITSNGSIGGNGSISGKVKVQSNGSPKSPAL